MLRFTPALLGFSVCVALLESSDARATTGSDPAGSAETSPTARLEPAPAPIEENKVMRVIRRIENSLRYSSYTHVTRVNEREGSYEFDCSGMTAWVLRRSAPQAHSAVLERARSKRPLARDYYYRIAATKPGKARWGWQRVARVDEAQPGDVIAWLKPDVLRSPYTGHVGFVMAPPEPLPDAPGAYLVRIADASSYQHQDDSRATTGNTGFGFGTILVQADPETGAPIAYGWFGQYSRWVLPAKMAIGRPLR